MSLIKYQVREAQSSPDNRVIRMEQWTEDLIQWDFTPVPLRAQTLLITCHRYLLRLGISVPVVLCANSMMAQIRPSVLAHVSNLHPYCIRLQKSQLNVAFNRKHGRNAHGKDKEKSSSLAEEVARSTSQNRQ